MKKIILMIVVMISAAYSQDKKLTLSESLEIGLQADRDLQISQSRLRETNAKISEINSMFFPQLKLTANYTRLSDNVPPFSVTTPLSPQPIIISEPILDNYTLKLSFQQPLFTGFKLLSSRKAAVHNYNAEQSEYSKTKNEIAFKIHSSFWNYYQAKQLRDLIANSLKEIENHLKDTKNFLKNGLATQNDYLKLQVQHSKTELQLIEAENKLKIARSLFNKVLNLPIESQTDIYPEKITVDHKNYSVNDLITEAKKNRNEVESLSFKLKAARENISASESGWYPSIYLTGNFNYSNPNPRYQPPVNEWNDTWDVGIGLSWDIWDWGLTSSKTTRARELAIQTETSLEKMKDNIEVEVYRNYLEVIKSIQKVKVSELNLEQASENYRITSEKYNSQLATSTDLIDAEVSELEAKTNIKTALVEYQLAKTNLEKSLGRNIY